MSEGPARSPITVTGWQYAGGGLKDHAGTQTDWTQLSYPEELRISSTGGTADSWPGVLGGYRVTGFTHSGRPVWQSSVRDDRFLFYNGNNLEYI